MQTSFQHWLSVKLKNQQNYLLKSIGKFSRGGSKHKTEDSLEDQAHVKQLYSLNTNS